MIQSEKKEGISVLRLALIIMGSPPSSSLLQRLVLGGRHALALFKGAAEDAFGGEAGIEADILHGKAGIFQKISGGGEAGIDEVFVGGEAGLLLEGTDEVILA